MNFHGRARISARHPVAQAICDRCGFSYSRTDLSFQFDYAGAALINTQLRVCDRCKDRADLWTLGQATALAPDPVPVPYPRPDDPSAMYSVVGIDGGGSLETENGSLIVPDDDANAQGWTSLATDGGALIVSEAGYVVAPSVGTTFSSNGAVLTADGSPLTPYGAGFLISTGGVRIIVDGFSNTSGA